MHNTAEILAPAGGWEQLIAAVRCGADGVYLGAKGFNARQNAENFQDLDEAVSYCHVRGVRVFVTLNTLVTDRELPALEDTLRAIAHSGADAVIVQDLAVARLVADHCPDMELHASTQMTIHNAAGAQALEALGFRRVVLARELTIPEICAIHEQTNLSLETFVHGALCMSVSGACYVSAMLGGRSGNRGLCAQPCRLDFRADGRPYSLSLKDLSAMQHLAALQEAGVTAFKIEGRMKRPEYVATAVTACREALAGKPYDADMLEAAFSRSGFTDGYLTGQRNLSMFGTRSPEDARATQAVQSKIAPLYRRERPAVPVDMGFSLAMGRPATLYATDGQHSFRAQGSAPEAATVAPTDEARVRRSLEKMGDTPFYLRNLAVEADGVAMLPASALNALRRDALAGLLALREAPAPQRFEDARLRVLPPHRCAEHPGYRLRFSAASQVWDGVEAERIILPAEAVTPALLKTYGGALVAELPSLLFPGDEGPLGERLARLKAEGLQAIQADNLGALRIGRNAGFSSVLGGAGLNVLNSWALAEYAALGVEDITVSFELHQEKLRTLLGDTPRGALVYGYLPLMRFRCCPAQGDKGCGACSGRSTLTDRTNTSFPLMCHRRRFSTLYNSVPLNLSDMPLPGMDFYTLYFTTETAEECRRIYEAFLAGEAPIGPRTRGLYKRGII